MTLDREELTGEASARDASPRADGEFTGNASPRAGGGEPQQLRRRSLLAAAGVLGVTGGAVAVATTTRSEPAQAAEGVTKRITIYAVALPGNQFGYGLTPDTATIPGPILEMYEGDTLEITLVNTTNQRLSIHPHGVDYSTESDGAPFNASFNAPGETRKYTWRSHEMTATTGRRFLPGSAGYWHYHDHAMGTDHGTAGLIKGLYGALIVRRRGDILPDKQFTVVFNDMQINNKVAPNTPMFEANLGQRVEWVAIGHGNFFHTFHLHAHRWADNRTGYLEGPSDPTHVVDNKDLNPGNSFGFQVIAGEAVGPGAWMYHCHVQSHSDTGMAGIFLVRNADGTMPPGAQEAIDRFNGHQHAAAAKASAQTHVHEGTGS
ncbi:multicopper oxidase domain-containing protein [Paractinoplanes lichenicola]|uniref:Multicopper oxidase domain-containing protein n=1 Tax=Paractinoplanes lichenicola TaxID=2802976 RepID=A0ABS1VUE1_9ACTN|nr:multicopper oxidase domain-containing protein [Actinoplanes lichenicola]MBL7258078.1 multicopper oxidase domain-containing protein [Actinoplanes lichenicola]